jgi:hypothetical protein
LRCLVFQRAGVRIPLLHMEKATIKKTGIIVVVLAVLIAGGYMALRKIAKSKSPEQGVDWQKGDARIHVFYNGPFKKGRDIFSENGLVPYGKVWRTGANEATYIETNIPLWIQGQKVNPGKYSIWTIPGPQTWQVIFNSTYPSWGIDYNGVAQRNPETDVAIAEVPVAIQDKVMEQFTITIEEVDDGLELIFWWDRTLVAVPISITAP